MEPVRVGGGQPGTAGGELAGVEVGSGASLAGPTKPASRLQAAPISNREAPKRLRGEAVEATHCGVGSGVGSGAGSGVDSEVGSGVGNGVAEGDSVGLRRLNCEDRDELTSQKTYQLTSQLSSQKTSHSSSQMTSHQLTSQITSQLTSQLNSLGAPPADASCSVTPRLELNTAPAQCLVTLRTRRTRDCRGSALLPCVFSISHHCLLILGPSWIPPSQVKLRLQPSTA